MYRQNPQARTDRARLSFMPMWYTDVTLAKLKEREETEVLNFLAERPIHTVAMAGFIRDNGLVSEHHRGIFYSCRNSEGKLEGVALIGHSILIETRTDRALEAFATLAKECTNAHLIM